MYMTARFAPKEAAMGKAENQAVAATFDPRARARARLHRAGRNVNARY